ncbi:MAG: outer membrane beta-barrel protein [Hyphomicrobium aestuarii]|nr:outer membrane beta-barrel protein [Hyphomicrobium aestuarii]
MRKLLIAFVTAVAFAATGTVASADQKSWTGLSIGIGGGGGAVVHDLTVLPGTLVPPGTFDFGFDGIGAEGAFGTVGVGLDYQLGSNWVIGAFADYDFSDIETTINLSVPPLGGLNASGDIKLNDVWTIGGRLGYLTSPNTLVYGLIGYSRANFDDLTLTVSGPVAASATVGIPSFDGWSAGFGMETLLGHNLSLKGEYRYSEFDRESLSTGLETLIDTRLEPSMHTGRLSVNYKFNFDRSVEPAPLK